MTRFIRHTFILALALIVVSCTDDPISSVLPVDLSTTPPPIDYSQAEPIELDNGVVYYIVKEGEKWELQEGRPGEGMHMFRTVRTLDGEVLASTYANNNTSPNQLMLSELSQTAAFSPGFHHGIFGNGNPMKEGETRVIIVPPEQGFQNSNSPYRDDYGDDTLVYEIELTFIPQN